VSYPKEKTIRSLVVRVQKSSMGHLIDDFDAGAIQSILQSYKQYLLARGGLLPLNIVFC